jgi:hypothetical protein
LVGTQLSRPGIEIFFKKKKKKNRKKKEKEKKEFLGI